MYYLLVTITNEGDETQEQVPQRGGRCPIPGNISGQVGRYSEQAGLVEDIPTQGSRTR